MMSEGNDALDERRRRVLEKGLDQYFSAYDSSQALASELIQRQKHPTDALILLCARLDALASDALGEESSHRKAFSRFVTNYGGERKLFDAVSIPDLNYEIGYHRWRLHGIIPAPGRLHRFGRLDDPLLHLIEDCGLPITVTEIGIMLDTLARILERSFRAKARQASSKARTVPVAQLKDLIEAAAKKSRLRQVAGRLPGAIVPLLDSVRVSNILYERFRCESIHGAKVRIDAKRFFSEQNVYWKPIYPIYLGKTYELIEFPASFLLDCLRACIRGYRAHLLAKKRVPHAIYFHGFEDADFRSTLEFLDVESISGGGVVGLKLQR